jgi:hypothetical protein
MPRHDYFTMKLRLNMSNTKEFMGYRGRHHCTNYAILFPNGVVTNILALHYLEHHRAEVPWSELYKIWKMAWKINS